MPWGSFIRSTRRASVSSVWRQGAKDPLGKACCLALCRFDGVLHGTMSYLLQSDSGNILETYSVAPGLDYPGVGPEHAFFKESKRAEYVTVTDEEALKAFRLLSETEASFQRWSAAMRSPMC